MRLSRRCKGLIHHLPVCWIVVSCLVVQFFNLRPALYFVSGISHYLTALIFIVIQGLLLLLYPVLGYLADVWFTRYHTLKCSFILLVSISVLTFFSICIFIVALVEMSIVSYFIAFGAILAFFSVGLFQSNAIQFGLDQLLEAPTRKLIAFIHWYYWTQNVGHLVLFYLVETFFMMLSGRIISEWLLASITLILCALSVACLATFWCSKSHFYIQRVGLSPYKNIYKVLQCTWKHKVPERRSAFTYWEEDIPRRIDLGKNKYGGPFTNEEVEDTKTFLRILPLLLCLFGYHLAGDGYSAPIQLQRTSCPSLPVLLLIVINPLHISALVTVVSIPLYRLVIVRFFQQFKGMFMLTKMWVGLYLSLLQVVIYIVVISYLPHHLVGRYSVPSHDCLSEQLLCYFNNCAQVNTCAVDNTYLWFIIPQLLNGLSSLLVSMTVFEFICAQAPHTTQGLLIGLWYGTFSIRYLVVGILDEFIVERRSWLICEGVKGCLILVSLVLFSCVSRRYRYRQRDEIVNVQGMIEDTHERWLDQEEEYMQERRALLSRLKLHTPK